MAGLPAQAWRRKISFISLAASTSLSSTLRSPGLRSDRSAWSGVGANCATRFSMSDTIRGSFPGVFAGAFLSAA